MTIEELSKLPIGTLLKMYIDDKKDWEVGEITAKGHKQVTVMWPESGVTQYIGLDKVWEDFVKWLEVEE